MDTWSELTPTFFNPQQPGILKDQSRVHLMIAEFKDTLWYSELWGSPVTDQVEVEYQVGRLAGFRALTGRVVQTGGRDLTDSIEKQ